MSDYVKELNIVDFLGIIVPGSILVLLLAGDNADLLLLWTSYFGADASPLVRGIFLAIAGYLAGMVLHEIGDLAEKGAWCFPCLDPKAYAINAVGIKDLNKATEDAQLKTDVSADQRCVFSSCARGIWGCLLALTILVSCTVGFSKAMSSAVNAATSPQLSVVVGQSANTDDPQNTNMPTAPTLADTQTTAPTEPSIDTTAPTTPETPPPPDPESIGISTYVVSVVFLAALLIVIFALGQKLHSKNNSADQNPSAETAPQQNPPATLSDPQNQWEILKRLCLQNPQIQTYVTQKGAPKKIAMFDSFRHVMRNLLIAVAIVNVFSIWHPIDLYRSVAAYFVRIGNVSQNLGTLTFWFCFVILFAFSRYSHFVYLRYKYSYEAFITKTSQDDEPDVTHHHIILKYGEQPQSGA